MPANKTRVSSIIKAGANDDIGRDLRDIIEAALEGYIFWEGTDAEYYKWVGNWNEWWPQLKRDVLELYAYETGEIYGIAGVSDPSDYGSGSDGGPFDLGV